jgi:chromosomal replication initiator protein
MGDLHQPPETIWKTTLGELQLQMPRETFDTWLRSSKLIAYEDGSFIIGVANIYAREWLEHRLKKVVLRTLAQVARRSVEVSFVVLPERAKHKKEADLYDAGPLLEPLKPASEPTASFQNPTPEETGLSPRLTFDRIASGSSNRMALAAAHAVLDQPGLQFNPLYIYGGTGLGKTHLLHAIGNACREKNLHVRYTSTEAFTNDLVGAIRAGLTADLRDKYRMVDVLLVDDVEFLSGKEATQEELYHTFNDITLMNGQIVLAGGPAPSEIQRLDSRLRSRFEGGLAVEILPPDYAMRCDILIFKAESRGFHNLPFSVVERLAVRSEGGVRELEGALNRVIATSLMAGEPPTVSMADEALGEIRRTQSAISVEDILMAVADHYGVTPADLLGRDRSREVSAARQVAIYIARQEADIPLQQIGDELGGRNHSTVLYSFERVLDLVSADSQTRRDVQTIMRTLRPARGPS